MSRRHALILFVALAAVAGACSGGAEDLRAEAVTTYAAIAHEAYRASLTSAQAMDEAIDAFVTEPTDERLDAARAAWLTARDDYGVTEVFRFYGGPIDDADGPEGLINAWPLDEAYIDYVDGAPDAGIVNDTTTYPTIDASVISELNEVGGEANISTGWHAIEFLLWGQDLSLEGPGDRPASDYVDAPNADRRAAYLATASALLVEHLTSLVDEWAPDADNYRAAFVALPSEDALAMILTGMGELTLGELAGERMTVAYEERSQEDEHSCFSDNTTNDYLANLAGIAAVAHGELGGVSGMGIIELIAAGDADVASALDTSIDEATSAAAGIPAPLDQWLVAGVPDSAPGRAAMLATIEALEVQAEAISTGADILGVRIG